MTSKDQDQKSAADREGDEKFQPKEDLRRLIGEYAADLRKTIEKLRKRLN
jgi:hypothetical protein